MIRTKLWASWLVVGGLAVFSAVAAAQEPAASEKEIAAAKAKAAAHAADREDAIALLKGMSDFLSSHEHFSFDAQTGFDALQANGQKLEFGSTLKVTLRRPDRLRFEREKRDGSESTLFFDGQSILVDLPEENAYVSVKKPGTLDAALDYLVDDLGTPVPLADLLHSSVLAEQVDRIDAGFVAGDAKIAGTWCNQVALRTAAVDAQLWITDGEQPLLQRLVITYKTEEGSPQFWAQFSDWNFDPKTPDSLFAYTPPEGATRIPIGVAVARAQEPQEPQEESK